MTAETTRRHVLEESFGVTPERMFEILTTPKAIRSLVGSDVGGNRCTRKGGSLGHGGRRRRSDTEFINSFEILEFDPPKRMLLGSGKYFAGTNWPIRTNMTTEMLIEPQPTGCILMIIQELSPADPLLDDFFDACVAGWQNSFEGMRNYLHNNPAE